MRERKKGGTVLGYAQATASFWFWMYVHDFKTPNRSLSSELQVILENLGIKHGCITTVHDITGTQPIVDMAMTKKKVSAHQLPLGMNGVARAWFPFGEYVGPRQGNAAF